MVSDLINDGVINFYKRYVDDTLVLIRPFDISFVLAKLIVSTVILISPLIHFRIVWYIF